VHAGPDLYSIRIDGRLGVTALSGFPALVDHADGSETILTGLLADRSALFGVLAEIEALGLELIEVRRVRPKRRSAASAEACKDSHSPLHHAQAIFAAFDAKDVAALADLMTDDVRLQIGNAEVVNGKVKFVAALEAFVGSVAAFRHTVTNVWSELDAVIAELQVHYTRLDGTELTLPCCNVFRLRDGAVADYRVYMDIAPVYA
jgi:ketosteroid isomerase-like protein